MIAMPRIRVLAVTCAVLLGGAVSVRAAETEAGPVADVSSGTAHQALFAVAFDGANGVAVGANGDIRESGDGGKTWKAVESPEHAALFGVAFNAKRAIAVGQKGAIVVRDEKGAWSAVNQTVSKERLLAVSMNGATAIAVGSFGALLRSTDGGANWESVAPKWQDYSSDGADPNLYAVHVGADGTVTAAGEFGIVARSTDGGATWESRHKGEATLFGLKFGANGVGYAVGQDGAVIRTADGGATWNDVDTGVKTNLLAVALAADGSIYATGMHELFAGRDDGKPWERLTASADGGGLWYTGLAAAPGANDVVAVGQTAHILKLGN
ncbi:MAG: YCF48-related protein [Rudaea sp.]|uniref:WD40/YVTN/BNR-like repeat-containing protein n=1 Tax=Rudaea sp. TaxID=2136325 RepID=UPI0039E6CEA0